METLAQASDEMFYRNLMHCAKRGREVEIWIEGISEPRIGFFAGLDEEFVQLCITETQMLSTFRLDMIVSMDETGRTMGALIRDKMDRVEKIMEKTIHFQKQAAFSLKTKATD